MKKYKKLLLTIAVFIGTLGAFTSCDMDVVPTEGVGSGTFWTGPSQASMFLNSVYAAGVPNPVSLLYHDTYTDDVWCQYDWESLGMYYMQNTLSPVLMSEYYGNKGGADYNFETITRANELLNNIDNAVFPDNALKERMKAEARFLKAVSYMGMTIALGDAPIFMEVPNAAENLFERNPASEVRAFVLSELEAVANILPPSYAGGTYNEKGRATSYAAWAYLARAALLFEDYPLAERAARQVMAGPFDLFTISSLTPEQELEASEIDLYIDYAAHGIDRDRFIRGIFSYEELWQIEHASPDNPEYVFSREYADNVSGQENGVTFTNIRTNQMGGWGSITPTQELVNAYWSVSGDDPTVLTPTQRTAAYNQIMAEFEASGMSFAGFCAEKVADGTIKDYDFLQEFRNRDARLYASILFPFKAWFQTEQGTNYYFRWFFDSTNESDTGYAFRKITAHRRSSSNDGNGAADYPNFRFAEVLLIFAEAHTRNTGYDGEVVTALNRLRDRVGMPGVPSSFASREAAIDFILKESRIELAGEGIRSRHVIRLDESYWNNAFNNKNIYDLYGNLIVTTKWDSRMRLRPLRANAMERNKLLVQNPGY